MGLDFLRVVYLPFDTCKPRWTYYGFADFRRRLAKEIGIDLDEMEGFSGDVMWELPSEEPLVYLLDHPDDSGFLWRHQIEKLLPRLAEIVDKWELSGEDDPNDDIKCGREFIKAVKEVIETGAAGILFT